MKQVKPDDKEPQSSTPNKVKKKKSSNRNYTDKAVELAENMQNRGIAG